MTNWQADSPRTFGSGIDMGPRVVHESHEVRLPRLVFQGEISSPGRETKKRQVRVIQHAKLKIVVERASGFDALQCPIWQDVTPNSELWNRAVATAFLAVLNQEGKR